MKLQRIQRGRKLLAAGAAAMLLCMPAAAQEMQRVPRSRTQVAVALAPAQRLPRLTAEKKGDLPTRDALRLRVITDVGNIRVSTRNSGHISYIVRIETDASQPDARQQVERFELVPREDAEGVVLVGRVPSVETRDRLWVTFDVSVPRNYGLDIRTEAGNVSSEDIEGQVTVYSGGGDITLGHVGGSSKLDTQGGHIRVQDVNGSLVATTVGGHILAGQIRGDATLRSGGGHVRVDYVGGKAQLESGGGSISILKTTAGVNAVTAGGRIDVGEAYGAIRARTGGGPIRVARVVGPTQFEASGGSIYLTRVEGPVRASTTSGTITAWITPDGKLQGGSQLICGQGDIVVYLPKELAITIQATIDSAVNHTISADPGVPLKISTEGATPGQRVMRAEGNLNGGGQILQLKTKAGNIRLRFSDAFQALNQQLYQVQIDETRRRIEMQMQMQLETQARMLQDELERMRKLAEAQKTLDQGRTEVARAGAEKSQSLFQELQRRFSEAWYGQVRVDSKDQDAKRLNNVLPVFPESAKRAGIQGTVQLAITIGKDGTVTNARLLSGHPILAQAAIDAVRQWRYSPTVSKGKPVAVVTLVAVEFRLD